MPLPKCSVPTHAQWKSLRDDAGGKKALSKVNMGKALDEFHAALAKCEKSGDLGSLNPAILAMEKNGDKYVADLKKEAPTYDELASVVTKEILGNLKAFVKLLEQEAKAGNKEANKVDAQFLRVLDVVSKGADQLLDGISALTDELSKACDEHGDGVSNENRPTVSKILQTGVLKVDGFTKALATLDKELLSLVSDNIKDNREVIEKYNSELGKAKGQTKECSEKLKFCRGKLTELSLTLKKIK